MTSGRMASEIAVVARCLALDAAAVDTCAALRERGIQSVLLKGAGLARRLATERQYGDVDLLVSPGAFDVAQHVLASLGYRPAMAGVRPDDLPLQYERSWWLPGEVALVVDLHRGFAGVADADAFWQGVWRTAEEVPLAGGRIAVPDQDHAALLVALHAAAPGGSAGPRADLERALAVLPVETWRAASSIARRYGADEAYALGLRVSVRGAAVAADLGLPDHCLPSRWLVAHHGSATGYALARLAELPGLGSKARHVGRRLLPSPAAMRCFFPLARRGGLGLFLAYVLRLARHAVALPRAARELRAAVRRVAGL